MESKPLSVENMLAHKIAVKHPVEQNIREKGILEKKEEIGCAL